MKKVMLISPTQWRLVLLYADPPQIIIIVRMLIAKYIIFEYYTLKLLVMRNVQKQLEIEVCTCKIEKTKIDYFRVTSQRPWLLHFI